MNWTDEGFLLSKNKYGENSIIIEVFTLAHGKCSGIVYGGTSRKIKNYLQIGNKIYVELNTKSENKLGYFKVEIIDPVSPYFFENKKKINCLFSSLSLLKILLPELQKYNHIYLSYSKFINQLKFNNVWIVSYIFWEIGLLKEIGFDMNLPLASDIKSKLNNDMFSVSIDNENVKVPKFLISKEFKNINPKALYYALIFIGNFIKKNILIPNNLNYPSARKNLEDNFR